MQSNTNATNSQLISILLFYPNSNIEFCKAHLSFGLSFLKLKSRVKTSKWGLLLKHWFYSIFNNACRDYLLIATRSSCDFRFRCDERASVWMHLARCVSLSMDPAGRISNQTHLARCIRWIFAPTFCSTCVQQVQVQNFARCNIKRHIAKW